MIRQRGRRLRPAIASIAAVAGLGVFVATGPLRVQQPAYQQTLRELGVNQISTIVFPLPVDLITPVKDAVGVRNDAGPERHDAAS